MASLLFSNARLISFRGSAAAGVLDKTFVFVFAATFAFTGAFFTAAAWAFLPAGFLLTSAFFAGFLGAGLINFGPCAVFPFATAPVPVFFFGVLDAPGVAVRFFGG